MVKPSGCPGGHFYMLASLITSTTQVIHWDPSNLKTIYSLTSFLICCPVHVHYDRRWPRGRSSPALWDHQFLCYGGSSGSDSLRPGPVPLSCRCLAFTAIFLLVCTYLEKRMNLNIRWWSLFKAVKLHNYLLCKPPKSAQHVLPILHQGKLHSRPLKRPTHM